MEKLFVLDNFNLSWTKNILSKQMDEAIQSYLKIVSLIRNKSPNILMSQMYGNKFKTDFLFDKTQDFKK